MSARIVQRVGQEYDYQNFLLMHAMSANTAGQLGSVIAGSIVLSLRPDDSKSSGTGQAYPVWRDDYSGDRK
jgi:Na+-transporting oxaloacetate decarboxylase beta subunit